ncbi:MAG: hypothetical protein EHM40_08450 [Chloroflexi bacterium]|nr:MAG: hypothetical protein EHM40_08450 [Chloroflexota bacterium]
MNIRCAFCQTPYTLSRVDMLDALQEMDAHNLTHYDAHCPRCRRATQLPRQRLEMFMPKWRDELKQFEAEMKANPQQEAPLPTHEPAAAAPAESTPAPVADARQGTPVKEKPARKRVTEKKPVAKAKPAARKPAAGTSKGKKTTKKK